MLVHFGIPPYYVLKEGPGSYAHHKHHYVTFGPYTMFLDVPQLHATLRFYSGFGPACHFDGQRDM